MSAPVRILRSLDVKGFDPRTLPAGCLIKGGEFDGYVVHRVEPRT